VHATWRGDRRCRGPAATASAWVRMNRLEAALRLASRDIQQAGLRWAVVGGIAVSVRTEPRFTRDLDLAVAVDADAQAKALVAHLLDLGYRTLASLEQTETSRLATVRLIAPGETETGVVVDLLFASSGIEPEVVAAAEGIRVFSRLVVPVASLEHLLALKVLARDDTRRPQDRVDIAALLHNASAEQIEEARKALRLITERRFNRDRDLDAELDRAVSELSGP